MPEPTQKRILYNIINLLITFSFVIHRAVIYRAAPWALKNSQIIQIATLSTTTLEPLQS